MIKEFDPIVKGIMELIPIWEAKLLVLSDEVISEKRNSQNRTIRQILGHMVDSASNNTHRVIHLQYQDSPLIYPNYANNGNNDRWIAIQDYQHEDYQNLLQLWKYSNLHYVHVINSIKPDKLNQEWIAEPGKNVSLREMVTDYLRHFELHLNEIEALIQM